MFVNTPVPDGIMEIQLRVVAMARIKPRLPSASVGGEAPAVSLSEGQWERIECAYGNKISNDLREAILNHTKDYLLYAQAESAARPVAEAEKYLRAISKAAGALNRAFDSPSEADARRHVNFLLKQGFSDESLKVSNANDNLYSFKGVLTSFLVACEHAKKCLSEGKASGFRPGATWDGWIRNIRSILMKQNLPVGYRKDSDKNKTNKASAFVRLIYELQTCIPLKYRRGRRHGTSLTELISRACSRQGVQLSSKRVTKPKKSTS